MGSEVCWREPGEVGPRQRGPAEELLEDCDRSPREGRAQVGPEPAGVTPGLRDEGPDGARRELTLRRGGARRDPLTDELHEGRVGGVLRDPQPADERRAAQVQVGWAPAELLRVQRQHDRPRADRLRSPDEGRGQLLASAPVELVPDVGCGEAACRLLHGVRALARDDHGQADVVRALRHRQVGVPAHEVARANGCQQHGCRQPAAEQLHAHVARRDVAQEARHDAPSIEGGPVGRRGALLARPAGHV